MADGGTNTFNENNFNNVCLNKNESQIYSLIKQEQLIHLVLRGTAVISHFAFQYL